MRIIKTEDAYREALARVEVLALLDPDLGSAEADQLEVLSLLVEDYERKNYTFDAPDPIDAIEFRMVEQGLRQRDLIPILGSRSRVSEVLSRKRPLTVAMIRSLSEGLGIPADVLVRPISDEPAPLSAPVDWVKFPVREMQKRGWIPAERVSGADQIEQVVKDFLARAGQSSNYVPLYRRNIKGLGAETLDDASAYSTLAWVARVLSRSMENRLIKKFEINNLSENLLREIAMLSRHKDGPVLAIEQLRAIGICVVIEPQLPKTLLDGAAVLNDRMQPVIGLTLRYDRADYFWFTLLHEIAHVWRHLNTTGEAFVDRIDVESETNRSEKEANQIARDALVPRDKWAKSAARLRPDVETIKHFAEEIHVHPAIVAGRIRFETGEYNKFTRLLGQGSIRKHFPDYRF